MARMNIKTNLKTALMETFKMNHCSKSTDSHGTDSHGKHTQTTLDDFDRFGEVLDGLAILSRVAIG